MPKGCCVWPSWVLVYMCFKINSDFLPFGLFLSGVSGLLMIRIIVAVMDELIKRKFCHAALWGKHETLQSEASGLEVTRKKCERIKKKKKKTEFKIRQRDLKIATSLCCRLLFRAFSLLRTGRKSTGFLNRGLPFLMSCLRMEIAISWALRTSCFPWVHSFL